MSSSIVDRVFLWTKRHKWEYRLIVIGAYLWPIYTQLADETFGFWNVVLLGIYAAFFGLMAWLWWRQDVVDEFERHTRAAIGNDASWAIAVALHMRTSRIALVNRVMRQHDIMNTPILDLPPEAKELRLILEDLTK
jgi:hypothetical protein